MTRLLYKRGQTSMIDLFIATIIFILIIGSITLIWFNYRNKLVNDFVYEDLQVKAFQVSDLLVKSPGKPSGWEDNTSSVKVIGLAGSDRVLDRDKIEAFASINHSSGVILMNLGEYNYYFELEDTSGGLTPAGDLEFKLERHVLYEGSDEIFKFTLWK